MKIHLRQNKDGSFPNTPHKGGMGRTAEERPSAGRQWVGAVFKGEDEGTMVKYGILPFLVPGPSCN